MGIRDPNDESSFYIRPMQRTEVDLAVDWAAAEGWNPGVCDAAPFLATDPGGFFVAVSDARPIACISAVAYDETYGFIGFYIVHPEHRGRGYGIRIWRAAMDHMGARTIGLDGVLAQQRNYEKSGFRLAYRNVRYAGKVHGSRQEGAIPIAEADFAAILDYDSHCHAVPRESFLRAWLAMPNAYGAALIEEGTLRGYGMIRSCRSGWKIGPLFADDAAGAQRLLLTLAARAEGQEVFLDTPETNAAAVALAERHGMKPCFATVRMYTQAAPRIALDKVFGVTTFELG